MAERDSAVPADVLPVVRLHHLTRTAGAVDPYRSTRQGCKHMARANKVCNVAGCPTIGTVAGKCDAHRREAQRGRESGGYNTKAHLRFRRAVLARDPVCKRCVKALSTVADHYPVSKRDLIAHGLDANDPQYGRGLCHRCHSIETAEHQPGGWHQPHGA
jgi:5-methylcytosine-specific restriction enzyme A